MYEGIDKYMIYIYLYVSVVHILCQYYLCVHTHTFCVSKPFSTGKNTLFEPCFPFSHANNLCARLQYRVRWTLQCLQHPFFFFFLVMCQEVHFVKDAIFLLYLQSYACVFSIHLGLDGKLGTEVGKNLCRSAGSEL